MNKIFLKTLERVLFLCLTGYFLYQACGEFYAIAWGTGNWLGEFSRTWAVLYYLFVAFCVLVFLVSVLFLWDNKLLIPARERIIAIRQRTGNFRWLLWVVVLAAPVWFFQYTALGVVFQKFHIRILVWIITVCLLTVLASQQNRLAGWNEFLTSLILTASIFSIAASLKYVNSHPFSLGWSEGNRLWDYSVMFGRDRYIYPPEKNIPVFLDFGRKLIGGLPFIFPGVTITMARLWVGLTLIIPYLLLGLALFRATAKNKFTWLLLVLWTFLFLKQGPIHAPLVISAALVALAWRAPLWYAILLLFGAGYLADTSRFTWIYAPGIWIVMLEFASVAFSDRQIISSTWKRSIALGVLGLFGGLLLPFLIRTTTASFSPSTTAVPALATVTPSYPVATLIVTVPETASTVQPAPAVSATPIPIVALPKNYFDYVVELITDQPFLWYRLLPNSTYENGILLSLLLAITPLLIILFYLSIKRVWLLDRLQKLSLILPLLAFLLVGLVASAKIGGGGDLHNMDMFLIGLLFVGAIAWQNGGSEWIQNGKGMSLIMKIVVVILLVNSSISPLLEMRSYGFGEDLFRLKILSDADSRSTLEMLPTQEEVDSAIQIIQTEVDKAKIQGEVLFIDQRQLLTFGYIKDVPLVPGYEKKLLMNQALSENSAYFEKFYADLAAQRFSLIISEPLRMPVKDSSYQFGEENNAWVKWVAGPVLCYYEPLETIKTVKVQLLVPNKAAVNCSTMLP